MLLVRLLAYLCWIKVWSSLHFSIFISFFSFSYSRVCSYILSFLLWRHSCSKKVPMEIESSCCMGGISFNPLWLLVGGLKLVVWEFGQWCYDVSRSNQFDFNIVIKVGMKHQVSKVFSKDWVNKRKELDFDVLIQQKIISLDHKSTWKQYFLSRDKKYLYLQ